MDINGWLTVITIVTAIFALMPNEEQVILEYKTTAVEKYLFLGIILFVLPYLILFKELGKLMPFLKYFTVQDGIEPPLLAFVIFFITLLYTLLRFFVFRPSRVNEKLIDYYEKLLYQKPFEDFFSILNRHHGPEQILSNWNVFSKIFDNPIFLRSVVENRSKYLIQFFPKYETKEEFSALFKLFLDNPNSILYEELYDEPIPTTLEHFPLLNALLKNIDASIKLGLLGLIEDHAKKILIKENTKDSRYNQLHDYPVEEKVGFDLPLYYHIRLIGLIYDTAIERNVNVHGIRQTMFQTIVKKIISNLQVQGLDLTMEYPNKYFWLLSEIFGIHSEWIRHQGVKEWNEESNLNSFVNSSYWLCLDELIKGYMDSKIDLSFITRVAHYDFLSNYYHHEMNGDFLNVMEEEVISRIPDATLVHILDKSLDEYDATDCYRLCTSTNSRKSIARLQRYLAENGTVQRLTNIIERKRN